MEKKKNELAVVSDFNLVTISGDLAEAIAEEMNGLGMIPFDRVKLPSGGGLAFEVPKEDEDTPETTNELVGAILYHHPVNAYWKEKFSGGNEQPDCSSMESRVLSGKLGISGTVQSALTMSLVRMVSVKPAKMRIGYIFSGRITLCR